MNLLFNQSLYIAFQQIYDLQNLINHNSFILNWAENFNFTMEISNIKIAAYVASINLLQIIWQKCLFTNWLLSLLSREKIYHLRVELWSANARNLRKNVFVDFIFFRRNISRISWKGAFVLYCNENISKFFLIN